MEVINVAINGKVYIFSNSVSEYFLEKFKKDDDEGNRLRENYFKVADMFGINNFFCLMKIF